MIEEEGMRRIITPGTLVFIALIAAFMVSAGDRHRMRFTCCLSKALHRLVLPQK
jgi:hypothetical protein